MPRPSHSQKVKKLTGMSRARNSRWGMLLHVNEAGIYGGQNKIGEHVLKGIAIYTWKFVETAYRLLGAAHKVVPISENRRKKLSYTWTWEQDKWRSMSKQNRRWRSTSCWNCNACMIICLKGMAFAGHCTQKLMVPLSEDRQRKSKQNTTSAGGYMEVKVKTK